MRTGNRIPMTYFVTSGVGESDITVHAGSYHLALADAGIEWANIMGYSSILPVGSRRIERPPRGVHGEVMDTIMAVATCEYGSTATAGLTWARLKDEAGKDAGGLVAEYSGPLSNGPASAHLHEMLLEVHANGFDRYTLGETRLQMRSVTPTKMYGTALVALCFTSYEWPEPSWTP